MVCLAKIVSRLSWLRRRPSVRGTNRLVSQAYNPRHGPQVDGRDTRMYECAGLLTDRTVMAHGVTLTTAELQMLARHGTAIAHCPLSNFFFADVPLDVLKCLDAGVKARPHPCPVLHVPQSPEQRMLSAFQYFAQIKQGSCKRHDPLADHGCASSLSASRCVLSS